MKQLNEYQVAWIKELRSGKYVPANGRLHSARVENGRCCLGVYCDVRGCEWKSALDDVHKIPYFEGKVANGIFSANGGLTTNESGQYIGPEFAQELDLDWREVDKIAIANDDAVCRAADENYEIVIQKILEIWKNKGYDVSGLAAG